MRKNLKRTKARRFELKARKLKRNQLSFSTDLNNPQTVCLQGGVSFALKIPVHLINQVLEDG